MNAPIPKPPNLSWPDRFIRFIVTGLPTTIQAEKKYVLWAHALFFIPAISMIIWISNHPSDFNFFADEATTRTYLIILYRLIIEATPAEYVWMMSIHLNHILTMSLQFIIGGTLLGLGTIFSLIYQGLYFGNIIGLSLDSPMPWLYVYHSFYRGALELLSMMLAGACGLRLGHALWWLCWRKVDEAKAGCQSAFNLFLAAAFFFSLTIPISIIFYPFSNAHILLKTIFNLSTWVICYAYIFWPRPPQPILNPAAEDHS